MSYFLAVFPFYWYASLVILTPYSANYMSWILHYLWLPLHMSKCTQKHYITKEIVSNTLIGLLIRNHKFGTGSETFINPVKLLNVFLQVKINTFLPIHEKKISSAFPSSCTILIFYVFFFSLSHSFFILTKLANSDRDESWRENFSVNLSNSSEVYISVSHSLKKGQGAGQKRGTFDTWKSPKRALVKADFSNVS